MPSTASDLMRQASIILLDEAHVRWTVPELVLWINDGLSAIVLAKPSASSLSVELELVAGTLQRLIDPSHLALLRLPRNLAAITTLGEPRVGGRAIRPTDRETLDAAEPNWGNPDIVPYRREVRQYVFDEAVPREFMVYPGNDGTGIVEAVISRMPTAVTPSGDPNLTASYLAPIDLLAPYILPLLEYVLYRSYSKDAISADPGRANFHLLQYGTLMGIKVQIEKITSPNADARITGT